MMRSTPSETPGSFSDDAGPYREGYAAFRRDRTLASNPYEMGTRERRWWDQGCAEAHVDWAHGRHAPWCKRRTTRMVPDTGHASPYMKDWGGHPPSPAEREKLPCTCGLAPASTRNASLPSEGDASVEAGGDR